MTVCILYMIYVPVMHTNCH